MVPGRHRWRPGTVRDPRSSRAAARKVFRPSAARDSAL